MAEFIPFRAIRYNTEKVRLDDVIAPPYDVVDQDHRARLSQKSPYNAIHIELPEESKENDKYAVARELFTNWLKDEILITDDKPCFYAYKMSSTIGQVSQGVIGALRLEELSGGSVRAHEQTIQKDKSDRLSLLSATKINTSPIWGLALRPGLTRVIGESEKTGEVIKAVDDEGTQHEMYLIMNPDDITAISRHIEQSMVLIADGHHRYETALEYHKNNVETNSSHVMALITDCTDESINIEAIHRILKPGDKKSLIEALETNYILEKQIAYSYDELLARYDRDSDSLIVIYEDIIVEFSPKINGLASQLVQESVGGLGEISYANSLDEALIKFTKDRSVAVILMPRVTAATIRAWAEESKKMPPKSTLFVPKPRTGFVFRSIIN
jgi:uncharacterized protein (DUF1015 family)